MDNIEALLGSVLNDPEAMSKLRDTARQFGIDADAVMGQAAEETNSAPPPAPVPAALPPIDPNMLSAVTKITPLLSKLKEEDDMTRLIHALRPYLSGERRKKADEADKIMAMLRLIPLLKSMNE